MDTHKPLDKTQSVAAPQSSIHEDIRSRYPELKPWISPGGCFSLRHPCEDGGYLSIGDPLDEIDARYLTDHTTALGALEVERYGPDGTIVEPARSVPLNKVSEWIDGALSRSKPSPAEEADH